MNEFFWYSVGSCLYLCLQKVVFLRVWFVTLFQFNFGKNFLLWSAVEAIDPSPLGSCPLVLYFADLTSRGPVSHLCTHYVRRQFSGEGGWRLMNSVRHTRPCWHSHKFHHTILVWAFSTTTHLHSAVLLFRNR